MNFHLKLRCTTNESSGLKVYLLKCGGGIGELIEKNYFARKLQFFL